jgi:undecaprenyl diphosphate synthase
MKLIFAINYGARTEIVEAVKAVAQKAKMNELSIDSIDEETFSVELNGGLVPDPDLVIRTSGEMRLSNFLLWQCAYSELYFTSTAWPDFDESELLKAFSAFGQRKRRFGGVEERPGVVTQLSKTHPQDYKRAGYSE